MDNSYEYVLHSIIEENFDIPNLKVIYREVAREFEIYGGENKVFIIISDEIIKFNYYEEIVEYLIPYITQLKIFMGKKPV